MIACTLTPLLLIALNVEICQQILNIEHKISFGIIDNPQDRKVREKINRFHGRFTVRIFKFMVAELINI